MSSNELEMWIVRFAAFLFVVFCTTMLINTGISWQEEKECQLKCKASMAEIIKGECNCRTLDGWKVYKEPEPEKPK